MSLLAVAARYLQHRAEQQTTGAMPPAYQLLYDFWAGRSDWQQAAGAQLALARRLAAEAPPDEATLGRIAVALGALSATTLTWITPFSTYIRRVLSVAGPDSSKRMQSITQLPHRYIVLLVQFALA